MVESKRDKETLKKIFLNALELKQEATLLLKHGKTKRAFFLIYTSCEEITKIRLHVTIGTPLNQLINHSVKSSVMKSYLEGIQFDTEFQSKYLKDKADVLNVNTATEYEDDLLLKYKDDGSIAKLKEAKIRFKEIQKQFDSNMADFSVINSIKDVIYLRNSSLYISGFDIENIDSRIFHLFYSYLNGYISGYLTGFKKEFPHLYKYFTKV